MKSDVFSRTINVHIEDCESNRMFLYTCHTIQGTHNSASSIADIQTLSDRVDLKSSGKSIFVRDVYSGMH